jgi:ABC-2 type transport system permease protein
VRVLGYLIRKEFLQLRRDRKMLPLIFVAPVLQLVLLGFAANLDVRRLPTAIVDRDMTSMSRNLQERFLASEYFDGGSDLSTPAEIEAALVAGTVDVVIVIPRGFTADRHSGRAGELQVLIDGTNSTVGTAALNYVQGVVSAASGRTAPVEVRSRVWFNPSMETRNFMVPGILAILLMLVTMVLSSLAIVKEKELGTLEQLNVTPISARQMVIGKLIPFVIIGVVDVALVLAVSQVVFGVPFRGSAFLLFAASLLFLASTLGLGLLISTVAENQQQAMLTAAFFVMIPMFFLSGFAFPVESMPRAIRWMTYVFPLRYYLVIIRGIFLKGAGLVELWQQFAALAGFGAGIILLAASRFRKRSA